MIVLVQAIDHLNKRTSLNSISSIMIENMWNLSKHKIDLFDVNITEKWTERSPKKVDFLVKIIRICSRSIYIKWRWMKKVFISIEREGERFTKMQTKSERASRLLTPAFKVTKISLSSLSFIRIETIVSNDHFLSRLVESWIIPWK